LSDRLGVRPRPGEDLLRNGLSIGRRGRRSSGSLLLGLLPRPSPQGIGLALGLFHQPRGLLLRPGQLLLKFPFLLSDLAKDLVAGRGLRGVGVSYARSGGP